MDPTITAAIIGAIATIAAAIISYMAGKRKSEKGKCEITKLENREAVYLKAANLIKSGRNIIDATWGSDAADLTESEKKALSAYLDGKKFAIARDNTDYREIFTRTQGTERERRITDAQHLLNKKRTNYRAKLMSGLPHDFPMLDFMVVDDKYTILSFLSSSTAQVGHRYLYIQSEEIANHLKEYFDECWRYAETLSTSNFPILVNADD